LLRYELRKIISAGLHCFAFKLFPSPKEEIPNFLEGQAFFDAFEITQAEIDGEIFSKFVPRILLLFYPEGRGRLFLTVDENVFHASLRPSSFRHET
jgi:hypothetical protein